MMQKVNILVTGAAGFIGWKVCEFLLTKPSLIPNEINEKNKSNEINVIGIDNLNDYYDVRLKHWRLEQLKNTPTSPSISLTLKIMMHLRICSKNTPPLRFVL